MLVRSNKVKDFNASLEPYKRFKAKPCKHIVYCYEHGVRPSVCDKCALRQNKAVQDRPRPIMVCSEVE